MVDRVFGYEAIMAAAATLTPKALLRTQPHNVT